MLLPDEEGEFEEEEERAAYKVVDSRTGGVIPI